MKKLLTVAFFSILFAFSANAQVYFNFGYGLATDKQTVANVTDESNSNSLFAGFSYNFKLVKDLGVEPGVNYYFNFYNDGEKILNYKTFHHGVQAPVLINYKFQPAKDIAFKVFAGPTLHYGLSDKTTTYVNGEKGITLDNYSDNSYSRFGLSASFGIGAEWNNTFRFKLGYDLGLNDLNKVDYMAFKQNLLSFTLGFIF